MTKSNPSVNIPHAREAMGKFKMQAASEAGSVDAQMAWKICPTRSMGYVGNDRTAPGTCSGGPIPGRSHCLIP